MLSLRLPVSHRGLAPHQFTPMPGVPRSLQPTYFPYDCSNVMKMEHCSGVRAARKRPRTRLNFTFYGVSITLGPDV